MRHYSCSSTIMVLHLYCLPCRLPALYCRPAAGGEGRLPEGDAARLWPHSTGAQVGQAGSFVTGEGLCLNVTVAGQFGACSC